MSACPASVRIAVPADAEELYSFVINSHEEMRHGTKDLTKIRATVITATALRRNPLFGIIRTEAGIVAAVGLYYYELWFSSDPVLTNFYWYTHPEHRKTTHAADLKAFCKWLGAEISMPVVLVDWSPEETGKTRLFARGTSRVGSMFSIGQAA